MDIRTWNPIQNRLYLATNRSKLIVIRDEIPGIEEKGSGKKVKDFAILPSLGSSFKIFLRGGDEAEGEIYNTLGRKVKEFNIKLGECVKWNGRDEGKKRLSSGVYFLKIKRGGNDEIATVKIILK